MAKKSKNKNNDASGSSGNDDLLGSGAGGSGGDVLATGAGSGTGHGSGHGSGGGVRGLHLKGTAGDDVLTGGDGNDHIRGGDGNDTLNGGAGKDHIKGGSGDDTIDGGLGNDKIDGGKGDDTILGGAGNDHIKGGSGDDTIDGGDGNDKIDGGKGDDSILGGAGNDHIKGGKGNDTIDGGDGDDRIMGGAGDDTIDGGNGNDLIMGDGSGASASGWGSGSGPAPSFNDTLNGGDGNDTVIGGVGNDTVLGGAGDDVLYGDFAPASGSGSGHHSHGSHNGSGSASGGDLSFNDYLDGGAGNDVLYAGRGDDIANYNIGENIGSHDVYDGGAGIDRLEVQFTLQEWLYLNPQLQDDLDAYLDFLALHTDPITGEADGAVFHFGEGDVSRFEDIGTYVDGVEVNTADDAVIANDDAVTLNEDDGATAFASVFGNDSAPDFVREIRVLTPPTAGDLTFNPGTPGYPDGSFSFSPNGDFEWLAAGESTDVSFTYEVEDADGDVDQATVTITVTGSNDAPTITAAIDNGAVVEIVDGAAGENSATLSDSGTIDFADVDLTDTHTVSAVLVSATDSENGAVAARGSLTPVISDASTGDGTGQITWTYQVNDGAVDDLAAGQSLTQVYTVTVTDESVAVTGETHATATQTITITINGTNDVPTITGAVASGSVTEIVDGGVGENSATLSDSGTIDFADVDLTDTHTVSAVLVSANDSENGVVAARGSFTPVINDVSTGDGAGQVTWTYQVNDGALDDLAAGQTLTQVYTVTVTDENGATVDQTVSVTINGTNDVPTVSGVVGLSTIDEDNSILITQAELLSLASDVDTLDTLSVVNVNVSQGNASIVNNGNDTWTVTPVQHWAGNIELAYDVTDGIANTAANAALTVNAVADAPELILQTGQEIHGFESGDFTGWNTLGSAAVVGGGTEGSYMARLIASGSNDGSVESFLGLTAGTLDGFNGNATSAAALTTSFNVSAGDQISYDWYFNATDYLPYNDFAFASLDGVAIELSDIAAVGNYGNSGWQTSSFTAGSSGLLQLGFGVSNLRDNANDPYLYIDNVMVDGPGVVGDEDTAIALNIDAALVDQDGSESFSSIVISGVPLDASLSAGSDDGNGNWTLSYAQLSGLTMTPPLNFNGDIPLTVTATSIEASNADTASTIGSFTVEVLPVNDAPVVEVPGGAGGFGANVLFVSDSGVGSDIGTVLAGDGHTVTSVLDNFSGGVTSALLGDLSSYDAVFWSASGDAYGNQHNATMFTNLQSYVNGGGQVFVTGYDSIASPTDSNLINFLGGTSSQDFGAPNTGATGANSLTTGAVDIQGVQPTGHYGDTDTLYAAAGTVTVVGSSYGGTGASWTLRSLGDGEIAYVSNGQYGTTGSHASWSNTSAGGDGAYNAAIRNFAFNATSGLQVDEDNTLSITGINVSDVDAASDPLLVSLAVDDGSLALTSTAGLSMVDGDGSDGTLSFTGSQASINAALTTGLNYTPDLNFNGTDTLSVTVNDQGNNGAGGPLSASATSDITVNAVNDAPEVTVSIQNPNLVSNGSFETGPNPGTGFLTYGNGSTAVNDWTVTGDSIDYISGSFWDAADGQRSIDLSGNNAGGISQSFSTVVGAQYMVTFQLAANTGGGDTYKDVTVSAGGSSQNFTFDSTGHSFTSMGWEENSFTFTATDTTSALTFTSLDANATGPALDDVQVVADGLAVNEDTPLVISGIAISDVDEADNPAAIYTTDLAVGDGTLSVVLAGAAGQTGSGSGTITLSGTITDINATLANGVTYQGDLNFNGTDAITVTVNDNGNNPAPALTGADSVNITVGAVNDGPVANADSNSGLEGNETTASVPVTGNVLGNDTDVDSANSSFTVTNAGTYSGTYGTLTLNANGAYSYAINDNNPTIDALNVGGQLTDTFNYIMSDNASVGPLTSSATLAITINGTNDAPVANADSNSGAEGNETTASVPVTGNVLANDTDIDTANSNFTVTNAGVYVGLYGTLTLNANGSYAYAINDANPTVDALNVGGQLVDTFNYTMSDNVAGNPLTSGSTLAITINGTNDAPVAVDDVSNTGANIVATFDDLAVTYGTAIPAGYAGLNWAVDGYYTADYYGGGWANADASYPNAAYEYNDASVTAGASGDFNFVGAHITGTATANWVNVLGYDDGLLTQQTGWQSISGSPTWIAADFTDVDQVVFDIYHESYGWALDNLTYNLSVPLTTDEDTAADIDVLANDYDVDASDTITISGFDGTSAEGATITQNLDGTLHYDPAAALQYLAEGEEATDTFTYTISDGNGGSDTATVTLTVAGVNDGPVANADSNSGAEGNETTASVPVTGNVLTNDTDIDTASSNFTVTNAGVYAGLYGTLTLNANGTYAYAINDANPTVDALNVGGQLVDTFNYTMSDNVAGNPLTSASTLAITINGTNDAPVAEDFTLQVNQLGNGGFEATPNFDGWNVSTATSGMNSVYSSSASINRSGNAIAGDDAVAVLSFTGYVPSPYGIGHGPTITSDAFTGQTGDTVRFVYELSSGGDQAIGTGYIRDANTNAIVQTIFNYQVPFSGSTGVQTVELNLAQSGDFVIDFRVGSYDATGGYWVGAQLELGFAGIIRDGVSEDEPFTFSGNDFLAHASDVDGGAPVLASVSALSAGGASVVLVGGDVVYDPSGVFDYLAVGEETTDTFTYTVLDGNGGFDTATASINVFGVNDAPVAEANKMIIVGEGQSAVSLNISAPTDFDTSDTLTITINGLPTNGLVTFANGNAVGNGQTMSVNQLQGLKFAANANADDSTSSFNYTVSDGNGGSDSSTVTVNTLNADHTLDYVGSYEVNDGPYWGSNPAVYSGVQAAALIFGGNANEYAISTNSSQNAGTVTNTAWYDGWGEHSGMVFADTYRLDVNGDGYAYPGGGNTARSAYVSDGLSDAYVNYVWREGIADETVTGGAGNDVIGGGGGDDTLIGAGGDDLFVFNNGGGDDTVNDFVAGAGSDDALDISDFGFANLASLLAVTNDAGANTVIQLDANDSITLIGVNEAQLHQDDFLFT